MATLPTRPLGEVFATLLAGDHIGAYGSLTRVCGRWRAAVTESPRLLRVVVEALLDCRVSAPADWSAADWRACLGRVRRAALWSAAAAPGGVVLGGAASPFRRFARVPPGARRLVQRARACGFAHGAYDDELRAIGAASGLARLEALVRADQACHATLLFETLPRLAPAQRAWSWTVWKPTTGSDRTDKP